MQWVVATLLIVTAVVAVHLPAIRQNFQELHWEDELFFAHEQAKILWWGDCFGNPLWPGLYRPLTTNCYYHLVGNIVGPDPYARVQVHHGLNVTFYVANGLLLFGLGRMLVPWPWAIVAALFFVSRRAHAEIVLNTVEFQVLGATFFSLAAILSFMQARRQERPSLLGLSGLALVLALLSKESALVVPAILLAYGWLYDERRAFRHYWVPVGIVTIWAVLFFTYFRSLSGYSPTGFGYTLAPLEVLGNYGAYFFSTSNPLAVAPGYPIMPALLAALATEWLTGLTLALLFALAAGLILAQRTLAVGPAVWLRPFAFGIAFFALATAPYAILTDRLFLRYGYFGHAGLALAAASLLWGCVLALQEIGRAHV